MKFHRYQYYKWVYILGTALTFVNAMFLQSRAIAISALVLLYSILFYKGIHILRCYKKTADKHENTNKGEFNKTYRLFRIRVALFWLAFIALCLVGKFVFLLERAYFYSCTFFFLFVDRYFVNAVCLLQKFSDPKGIMVLCCCGCPCRGWDLMMINTPLLFALTHDALAENIFILLCATLAVLSLICWETQKYKLVEIKEKCQKPCDLKYCREHLE